MRAHDYIILTRTAMCLFGVYAIIPIGVFSANDARVSNCESAPKANRAYAAIRYRRDSEIKSKCGIETHFSSRCPQNTFKAQLCKWALKMHDLKMQDMNMTDQITGHEIAGPENAGHKNATFVKVGVDHTWLTENTRPENARHEIAGPENARHKTARHHMRIQRNLAKIRKQSVLSAVKCEESLN